MIDPERHFTTDEIALELNRMARDHYWRKVKEAALMGAVAAEGGAVLALMLTYHDVLYPVFSDVNVVPGRGAAFHRDLLLVLATMTVIVGVAGVVYNWWTRHLRFDEDDTEQALRRLTWRGGLHEGDDVDR